jgi:hypothetical protein
MALPIDRSDREFQKFVETVAGLVAVRVLLAGGSAVSTPDLTAATPVVTNTTLLALTEAAVIIPAGTKRFTLRMSVPTAAVISPLPGGTAVRPYFSLMKGVTLSEENLNLVSPATLYVKANLACVVEMLSWS